MKKLILIGTIVAAVGLAAAVTGSIVAKEKLLPIAQASDYAEATPYVVDAAEVTSLDLHFDNRAVAIVPHDEPTVIVEYYVSSYDRIEFDLSAAGVLSSQNEVDHFLTLWGFSLFMNSRTLFTVTVHVPATNDFDISVVTYNGKVSIGDGEVGNLSLETYNGAIEISDMGSVRAMDLLTRNGTIDIRRTVCAGLIDAETYNGLITMSDVTADRFKAKTSNGNVNAVRLTSLLIELTTYNGNVTCSVVGSLSDYRVAMSTTYGSYYLNGEKVGSNAYNTHLQNLVKLTTFNGNVSVSFVS